MWPLPFERLLPFAWPSHFSDSSPLCGPSHLSDSSPLCGPSHLSDSSPLRGPPIWATPPLYVAPPIWATPPLCVAPPLISLQTLAITWEPWINVTKVLSYLYIIDTELNCISKETYTCKHIRESFNLHIHSDNVFVSGITVHCSKTGKEAFIISKRFINHDSLCNPTNYITLENIIWNTSSQMLRFLIM